MESIQHRLDVLYKRYWLQQLILAWETIIFNQFITGLFHWCNLVHSTSLWLQQKDIMHPGKVKITSVEHLQNSPRKWYCLWDAVEHPNLISKRGTMQHQSKFQSLGSISDHYSIIVSEKWYGRWHIKILINKCSVRNKWEVLGSISKISITYGLQRYQCSLFTDSVFLCCTTRGRPIDIVDKVMNIDLSTKIILYVLRRQEIKILHCSMTVGFLAV